MDETEKTKEQLLKQIAIMKDVKRIQSSFSLQSYLRFNSERTTITSTVAWLLQNNICKYGFKGF